MMHIQPAPVRSTDAPKESLGGLLRELMMHSTALMKGEVALVRSDLCSKIVAFRSAAVLTALGMGFALLACIALLAAAIVALAAYVGFVESALICGAALGIPAAVFLSKGMGHLKRLSI